MSELLTKNPLQGFAVNSACRRSEAAPTPAKIVSKTRSA